MATDVRVPTTGNAGEDAVVLEWNVTEGSDVTTGDVLVTLETAKATIDVEAPISGHVLRTFYAAGDEVGDPGVLAVLGEPGEQMPPEGSSAGPAADADDMGATSPAHPTPAVIATQPGAGAEQDGRTHTTPTTAFGIAAGSEAGRRVWYRPHLARRDGPDGPHHYC